MEGGTCRNEDAPPGRRQDMAYLNPPEPAPNSPSVMLHHYGLKMQTTPELRNHRKQEQREYASQLRLQLEEQSKQNAANDEDVAAGKNYQQHAISLAPTSTSEERKVAGGAPNSHGRRRSTSSSSAASPDQSFFPSHLRDITGAPKAARPASVRAVSGPLMQSRKESVDAAEREEETPIQLQFESQWSKSVDREVASGGGEDENEKIFENDDPGPARPDVPQARMTAAAAAASPAAPEDTQQSTTSASSLAPASASSKPSRLLNLNRVSRNFKPPSRLPTPSLSMTLQSGARRPMVERRRVALGTGLMSTSAVEEEEALDPAAHQTPVNAQPQQQLTTNIASINSSSTCTTTRSGATVNKFVPLITPRHLDMQSPQRTRPRGAEAAQTVEAEKENEEKRRDRTTSLSLLSLSSAGEGGATTTSRSLSPIRMRLGSAASSDEMQFQRTASTGRPGLQLLPGTTTSSRAPPAPGREQVSDQRNKLGFSPVFGTPALTRDGSQVSFTTGPCSGGEHTKSVTSLDFVGLRKEHKKRANSGLQMIQSPSRFPEPAQLVVDPDKVEPPHLFAAATPSPPQSATTSSCTKTKARTRGRLPGSHLPTPTPPSSSQKARTLTPCHRMAKKKARSRSASHSTSAARKPRLAGGRGRFVAARYLDHFAPAKMREQKRAVDLSTTASSAEKMQDSGSGGKKAVRRAITTLGAVGPGPDGKQNQRLDNYLPPFPACTTTSTSNKNGNTKTSGGPGGTRTADAVAGPFGVVAGESSSGSGTTTACTSSVLQSAPPPPMNMNTSSSLKTPRTLPAAVLTPPTANQEEDSALFSARDREVEAHLSGRLPAMLVASAEEVKKPQLAEGSDRVELSDVTVTPDSVLLLAGDSKSNGANVEAGTRGQIDGADGPPASSSSATGAKPQTNRPAAARSVPPSTCGRRGPAASLSWRGTTTTTETLMKPQLNPEDLGTNHRGEQWFPDPQWRRVKFAADQQQRHLGRGHGGQRILHAPPMHLVNLLPTTTSAAPANGGALCLSPSKMNNTTICSQSRSLVSATTTPADSAEEQRPPGGKRGVGGEDNTLPAVLAPSISISSSAPAPAGRAAAAAAAAGTTTANAIHTVDGVHYYRLSATSADRSPVYFRMGSESDSVSDERAGGSRQLDSLTLSSGTQQAAAGYCSTSQSNEGGRTASSASQSLILVDNAHHAAGERGHREDPMFDLFGDLQDRDGVVLHSVGGKKVKKLELQLEQNVRRMQLHIQRLEQQIQDMHGAKIICPGGEKDTEVVSTSCGVRRVSGSMAREGFSASQSSSRRTSGPAGLLDAPKQQNENVHEHHAGREDYTPSCVLRSSASNNSGSSSSLRILNSGRDHTHEFDCNIQDFSENTTELQQQLPRRESSRNRHEDGSMLAREDSEVDDAQAACVSRGGEQPASGLMSSGSDENSSLKKNSGSRVLLLLVAVVAALALAAFVSETDFEEELRIVFGEEITSRSMLL